MLKKFVFFFVLPVFFSGLQHVRTCLTKKQLLSVLHFNFNFLFIFFLPIVAEKQIVFPLHIKHNNSFENNIELGISYFITYFLKCQLIKSTSQFIEHFTFETTSMENFCYSKWNVVNQWIKWMLINCEKSWNTKLYNK